MLGTGLQFDEEDMITTNRRKSGGGRIKEGLRGGSHMICVTRSKRGKLSYRTNLKSERGPRVGKTV